MKKNIFLIMILLLIGVALQAQTSYFPPTDTDAWETTSPESLNWCNDSLSVLKNYLNEQNSKAFLVLKDGKIVVEWYFDTFTADSVWYWASAGKTITSLLVGKAQEQGLLSINDKSSDYLGVGWTSCTTAQEEAILVKHQLSMSTGLDDNVADPFCTLPACLEYKAAPETRWAYHNAPYTLLDGVIEEATGQTLQQYTNAILKNQIGFNGLWLKVDYNNVFWSKPRVMARFGILMLNNGVWNSNTIVNAAYLDEARQTSQNKNLSYGYLWWLNGKESFMVPELQVVFDGYLLPDAPADTYSALGKNGQVLSISPSKGLVIVRMGEAPDGSSGELVSMDITNEIWKKLNASMRSCEVPEPTALSEYKKLVKIHPNPSKEGFTVSLPAHQFNLVICDLQGRQLFSQENINEQLYFDKPLAKGIYVLHISDEKEHFYTEKIVIE
ncbi:MAG: serine hydrolase [Thermonemataceae bacterium]|nr:serine hydrolase [Thermonemataceae bacterium]